MTRKIIDFGNGWLKHIQDGQPVTVPAAIAPVFDRLKFTQCPVFEYRGGASVQIQNGSQWVAGLDAFDFAPTDLIRVGDIPKSEGKARYGLQLLASTLEPIDQSIDVLCSVPNVTKHGAELERALRGTHQILRNGRAFTLTVNDVTVKPEGFGAVYGAICDGLAPADKMNVGLDIGRQTAIVSVFNPRGQEIENMRVVVDAGGTQSLFSRIGSHSSIVSAFGGEVAADDIEMAVQAAPHSPELDGFRFESLYRQMKQAWLGHIVERAKTSFGEVFPRIGAIVVFGGGANLVRADLSALPKTVVLTNAQTANVEGLARLPIAAPIAA